MVQRTTNFRVAAYYAVGASLLLVPAILFPPWGLVLLWPSLCFAVVAAAYARLGPRIYGKHDGSLPWHTRIFMAPMLLGQGLSLRHYQRQCRPWDQAAPGVWMGKRLNDGEAEKLVELGISGVLDLTSEFAEVALLRKLAYLNLPILDLTPPTEGQLLEGVRFMKEHAAMGGVYVHCKIGYSRTAAFVGAYLLAEGLAANVEEAMEQMQGARPTMIIRPEVVAALRGYHESLTVQRSQLE